MIHSDSIKELATALAKAQGELPGAKKDANNTFFKSKYADLASTVEALRASFPKHGLSYVQAVTTTERGGGCETMLMHSSGEWIRGSEPFDLPVNKADAQGFGSAITYARRYSLAAICGVAPEDDDGNAAAAAKPTPVQKVAALDNKILPRAIPANIEGQELYDALPDDARRIVDETVDECIALVRGGDLAGALQKMREACSDHEDELIYASRLPSDARNKMKAEKRRLQAAALGPEFASQA
jgi:hypothetical protein